MELRTTALTVACTAALLHLGIFACALRLILRDIRREPCTPYGQIFGYLIIAGQTILLLGTACAYHGLRGQMMTPWQALLEASATSCIAPVSGVLFPGLDLLVNRPQRKRMDIFIFFAVLGILIGLATPFFVCLTSHQR